MKKMLFGILIFIILIATSMYFANQGFFLFRFGDSSIKGNGNVVTQNYPFTKQPFDSIDLNTVGEVQLQIIYNPKTADVAITTDSNLLPYIQVYVKNKTLYISKKEDNINFSSHTKQKITVTTNKLQSLILRGAGDIVVNDVIKAEIFSLKLDGAGDTELSVNTKNLTVATHGAGYTKLSAHTKTLIATLHGAGNMKLSGDTKTLMVDLHGAGKINTQNLKADKVKASVSGSGDILTNATKKISAVISGAGSIKYSGNPKEVEKSITGSGEIVESRS